MPRLTRNSLQTLAPCELDDAPVLQQFKDLSQPPMKGKEKPTANAPTCSQSALQPYSFTPIPTKRNAEETSNFRRSPSSPILVPSSMPLRLNSTSPYQTESHTNRNQYRLNSNSPTMPDPYTFEGHHDISSTSDPAYYDFKQGLDPEVLDAARTLMNMYRIERHNMAAEMQQQQQNDFDNDPYISTHDPHKSNVPDHEPYYPSHLNWAEQLIETDMKDPNTRAIPVLSSPPSFLLRDGTSTIPTSGNCHGDWALPSQHQPYAHRDGNFYVEAEHMSSLKTRERDLGESCRSQPYTQSHQNRNRERNREQGIYRSIDNEMEEDSDSGYEVGSDITILEGVAESSSDFDGLDDHKTNPTEADDFAERYQNLGANNKEPCHDSVEDALQENSRRYMPHNPASSF